MPPPLPATAAGRRPPAYRPENGPPPGFAYDSFIDPNYKLFLDHLRVQGHVCVLDIPPDVAGESAVHVTYEVDRDPVKAKRPRFGDGEAGGGVKASPLKSNRRGSSFSGEWVDKDYKFFLDNVEVRDGVMVLEGFDGVDLVYDVQIGDDDDDNGGEIEEEGSDVEIIEGHEGGKVADEVVELGEEDEVGRGVLESRKTVKEELLGNGAHVRGESDSSSSMSIVPSQRVFDFDNFLRSKVDSPFKSKLMSVVESPFSQKECDDLMNCIKIRKPIVKYKHLRDDSIPYQTNEIGFSYFDHYPELAKLIYSVNTFTRLSLLRGFFFWLENVGHEGAFMPWPCRSDDCKIKFPAQMEI